MYKDPRVLRTRSLIIDSFLFLMKEKDFHSISIKDITKRATINRATFYRHFTDKYLLLENIVYRIVTEQVFEHVKKQSELNEKTLQLIVYSFCDLVEELQQTFERNYDTVISLTENKMKAKLINIVTPFFQSNHTEKDYFIAVMLVTSIYSASCAWISGGKSISRENFSETIIPFLMGGISRVRI